MRNYLLARRALHPGAWWVWALCIAAIVSMTTNPLVLAMAWASLTYVVVARRGSSPWAKAFPVYMVIAAWIVIYRIGMYVLVGNKIGVTPLVNLPEIPLPEWVQGITLLGPIYWQGLSYATLGGLSMGTMIVAVGAANSLANPKQLVKSLPGALGEVGTAVTIGIALAPQMAISAQRIHRARALRGDDSRGVRAFARILMPVFQDTLDHSLALAASMDARGYGANRRVDPVQRRLTEALSLIGIVGVCVGLFTLLDASAPSYVAIPCLIGGVGLMAVGMWVASAGIERSVYHKMPWGVAEWITCVSAIIPLVIALAAPKLTGDLFLSAFITTCALTVATVPGFLTPQVPFAPTRRNRPMRRPVGRSRSTKTTVIKTQEAAIR
ncbi:MAG: energy-coupling factor transporter transmembrane component T [Corynebacterium sp.]|nr:energy-coupling factor transporter transmembrane component T [Corynebacterium sp.]